MYDRDILKLQISHHNEVTEDDSLDRNGYGRFVWN
jgi:hypothetical protein